MARTASLLSPYYERDIAQSVRVMEAEDWADALSEFPQWAIQKAVQWWKSADNPDRRKRPLEGDIAARSRLAMGTVRAAETRMRLEGTYRPPEQPMEPRERISPDRRAAILAEYGFGAKRMEAVVQDGLSTGPKSLAQSLNIHEGVSGDEINASR